MNAFEDNDGDIDLLAAYRYEPSTPFDREKMAADARAAVDGGETGDGSDDADIEIMHARKNTEKDENITFDDEVSPSLSSDGEKDGEDDDASPDENGDDGDNPSSEHDWDDDRMSVILDKATMGAVKRNDTLFFWQIEGLLKDNGTQYSWMHLRDNPPKLVFKRPNEEPFIVILGKTEANQLAPALERVCRAYNAVPIDDPKREHLTRKNWKRKMKEMFEDNPIGFVARIATAVFIAGIMIAALIMSLA